MFHLPNWYLIKQCSGDVSKLKSSIKFACFVLHIWCKCNKEITWFPLQLLIINLLSQLKRTTYSSTIIQKEEERAWRVLAKYLVLNPYKSENKQQYFNINRFIWKDITSKIVSDSKNWLIILIRQYCGPPPQSSVFAVFVYAVYNSCTSFSSVHINAFFFMLLAIFRPFLLRRSCHYQKFLTFRFS